MSNRWGYSELVQGKGHHIWAWSVYWYTSIFLVVLTDASCESWRHWLPKKWTNLKHIGLEMRHMRFQLRVLHMLAVQYTSTRYVWLPPQGVLLLRVLLVTAVIVCKQHQKHHLIIISSCFYFKSTNHQRSTKIKTMWKLLHTLKSKIDATSITFCITFHSLQPTLTNCNISLIWSSPTYAFKT